MSEVCEKHGPYSTFCRECDLDTIEKYHGRVADSAPELLSLLLTRDEIQDWRASAYPRGWDRRLADTALDAIDRAAELAAKLADAERERDTALTDTHDRIADAETRADRAEAALVAAQEAMRESVRPEVTAFAMLMERELRANDHKTSWRKMSIHDLEKRLREEVDELSDASRWRSGSPTEGSYARRLGSECADVANFAMMIADVAGALPIPAAKPEGE